jgi:pyruvate ferredoxin oxidoreductase beta subunit
MVNVKELAKGKEQIDGGTFACSGCQAIYGLRMVGLALGKETVVVNAAGCMTLTVGNPYTCFKFPWLYNAMENAASTATGVKKGFEIQGKKINVVCYVGDGATSEIGLASLSGACYRGDDIIYVCYNNGNYANTGHQVSAETPEYARTKTSPVGKVNKKGNLLPRKSLCKMMAQNGAAYVATASTGYPLDFVEKLKKAASMKGFKFIDLLSPCEPGWLVKTNEMHKVGKLIVDSGMWPLYEIVDKKVIMGRKPSMKVDSVLAMQGRFKHLNKTMVKDIQKKVDKEWELIDSNRFWETCEY